MDFIAKVLAAILGRFLADELKAWLPSLSETLINRAVHKLPEELRERYSEEWRSHMAEVPGEIGKLFHAAGCFCAGWHTWKERKIERLRTFMRTYPGITRFLFHLFSDMNAFFIMRWLWGANRISNPALLFLIGSFDLSLLMWANVIRKEIWPAWVNKVGTIRRGKIVDRNE